MFVGRDPLSSATRRRICEYVTKRPGLHLRAIARGVELDTNHTKYHLTYLEQHGLVSSERVHGYWAFYPSDGALASELGELDSDEKAQLFLVRKEVPRRVIMRLLEVNEANHKVLQEAAGVSASTLYYHLRRMADKEVVVSRKQGPARLWKLKNPELSKRLLEVSNSTEWFTNDPQQDTEPGQTVTTKESETERWANQPSVVETNINQR
jgi:predicted transcriptional regulator